MKNFNKLKSCCLPENSEGKRKGILKGILYGLAPHTFCILFIIFSVLGTTTATNLLKPFLLNRYFFYFLIALSFIFATISAIFYLKKNGILSLQGVKRKWKYLSILYGTTLFVNLILFMIIFPIAANVGFNSAPGFFTSLLTLEVDIPCPGHAPLIVGELKKISGVENVKFKFPNLFEVNYHPQKTSEKEILSLKVFNIYKAKILNRETEQLSNNSSEQTTNDLSGCTAGCGGLTRGCGCGCGCGR